MPTPILHLLLHYRHHPPQDRPLPRPLRLQGHTLPLLRTTHQKPTDHREPTVLQEVTTPRRGATTPRPGATTPHRQATTTRRAMTLQEATEHMIHLELTQQQEATPRPHRMSRHPHTGNPRPSAMITLITRQNPLTDSFTPPPRTLFPHCRCVSVCVIVCLCACVCASACVLT